MTTEPGTVGRGARGRTDSQEIDSDDLLDAITDERSRSILAALDDEARTAAELEDRLGIPQSTLYRKLDSLVEANLLGERVRLRSAGHHTTEYVRCIDGASLTVDLCSGVEIAIDAEDGAVDEAVQANVGQAISPGAD